MAEFFEELEKPEDQIVQDYRAVFGGVTGQRVLSDILVNLCDVFCYIKEPQDPGTNMDMIVGAHNVGIAILSRLGIPKAAKLESYIKALMDVPITKGG